MVCQSKCLINSNIFIPICCKFIPDGRRCIEKYQATLLVSNQIWLHMHVVIRSLYLPSTQFPRLHPLARSSSHLSSHTRVSLFSLTPAWFLGLLHVHPIDATVMVELCLQPARYFAPLTEPADVIPELALFY